MIIETPTPHAPLGIDGCQRFRVKVCRDIWIVFAQQASLQVNRRSGWRPIFASFEEKIARAFFDEVDPTWPGHYLIVKAVTWEEREAWVKHEELRDE